MIVIASNDRTFCDTIGEALLEEDFRYSIMDSEAVVREYLRDHSQQVQILIYDSDLLGTEFLHRLRSHKAFQLLPIVVAAGIGNLQRVEDYIDLGASYFLAKPVQKERFLEYLQRIVESQKRHMDNI